MSTANTGGNSNSNLPSVWRLYTSNYPTASAWFEPVLESINKFTIPVYGILNAGIDITANTLEEIYQFEITPQGTPALNFTPQKFVGAPHGIVIGQCLPAPISVPYPVWNYLNGQVQISNIFGLQAGTTYQITLRIF
jgi:hypothetical protein